MMGHYYAYANRMLYRIGNQYMQCSPKNWTIVKFIRGW